MTVRLPFVLLLSTALLLPGASAQEQKTIAYPARDILSPFRNPVEVYAPPDELFRALRTMQELAADPKAPKSYDEKGREVLDDVRWRAAYADVQRLGLDAGYLAQIIRLSRNAGDRATALYAMFFVDNPSYAIELIEHIPGEPERKAREAAFPRAVEFLRRNLARRFGDLTDEQKKALLAVVPEPGSPAAKARGVGRAPQDSDTLHQMRVIPFLQLLDLDDPLDQAQALWFLKEVFRLRIDLALMWLEPALPRIRQLVQLEDERVRQQAIELLQVVGPAGLRAPPEDPRDLVTWADEAAKGLFPPIRNLNDAVVQLHPSPERDAVVAAGEEALRDSAIGDPFVKQGKDGMWIRGFQVIRVPDALKPLAIPAGAIVTTVNGIQVGDAKTLLQTVKDQLRRQKHPRRLLIEYLRNDAMHAIEYRVM
ncbi:MAG: hypothetical protein MUC36_11515 [Planctomycetes bacterium]|jgi:hypothetical protein|nr:hypothetical protein [Planctomycetota bacterium]